MKYVILILAQLIIAFIIKKGRTPKIWNKAGALAELGKVAIGNAEQWILIRTENTANPVILFVHGGPGTSQLTLNRKATKALEKHFTVVNWDQRGAGKSYSAISDKNEMNIGQFVSDIIELSQHLAQRFKQDKIILAGHSWGSAISMMAIKERPELFSAYIGIGQVSDMTEGEKISYEWTLQQATQANDKASIRKLTEMGCPPYTGNWQKKFMTERQLLGKFGGEYYKSKTGAFGVVIKNLLFSAEYTFFDKINFFRGIFGSVALLFPALLKVNLFEQVPEVKVPVWFMLGRNDFEVPSVLSAKYFEALQAPAKQLIWFEQSAHMPNTEERDLFNKILIEQILPTVTP